MAATARGELGRQLNDRHRTRVSQSIRLSELMEDWILG
jgi:hypothetical protein